MAAEPRDLPPEFTLTYDKMADSVCITFVPDVAAITVERDDGILVRVNPDTRQVVGITVMDARARTAQHPASVKDIRGSLLVPESPVLA